MEFELSDPVLFVGIGGAGSKLAMEAKERLEGSSCLLVSHDKKDLVSDNNILIKTGKVLNPSTYLIRGSSIESIDTIREQLVNYSTIIVVANLGGKTGSAMVPIIAQLAREENKNILTIAIMPFKFEKDRIFFSGISLKRVKQQANSTIIIDNDALLESNPDLTPDKCYKITNDAVLELLSSLKESTIYGQTSILSTSKESSDVEKSLKDSIKMLYEDAPPKSVKRAMLYVMGGNKIPVGKLNSITNVASGIFDRDSTRVGISTVASQSSKVVMLSSIEGETRFDNYDPLGVIDENNVLDWNIPDCSINVDVDLVQLEHNN